MSTVAEKLHKWSVQELNLVSEGGQNKIPDVESFKCLTKGKNKKIWNYVVNHVRSQSAVEKIKRTLYMRKYAKVKEDEFPSFDKINCDIAELQSSVLKATEKRQFLMRKLSAIEDRILSTEQNIDKINDEVNKISHKTTMLELLRKRYENKNASLKNISEKIASHINYLCAYQSCKISNLTDLSPSYGFLYDSKFDNGTDFRVKELIKAVSTVIEIKLYQEYVLDDIVLKNIQKNNRELKKTGFILTDLVFFLKTMSDSDKQNFTATILQNVSIKDLIHKTKQTDDVKQLLCQMKYDNVHNSLCVLRNKNKINHLQPAKNQICKGDRQMSGIDYEPKLALLEKLAENESLIVSNNYIEENLILLNKAEILKKKSREKYDFDLSVLVQKFYKNADFTFYLLNTVSSAFKKVLLDLDNLQSFSHEILQPLLLLPSCYLQDVKANFLLDRKLMWDYYEKIDVVEPLKSEPYNMHYTFSPEVRKCFFIQPFENCGTICRNLIDFKEELKAEALSYLRPCMKNKNVITSDIYENIIKKLQKMRVSNEKSMVLIDQAMMGCEKNKNLIQEWWEQNAQFIPDIEYEGKTLKMWVDILHVMDDFEPINLES